MSKVKPDYDGDEPYLVIYGGEGSETKKRIHFNFHSKLQMPVNAFKRTTIGIRNGVWMFIIFVVHCVMGIVNGIALSRSGIGGIKLSLSTPRDIVFLNGYVFYLSNSFLICFILLVYAFPCLRKNSNTYFFSAVFTVAVGVLMLNPIVFESQKSLNFFESYKEFCIVQYVCVSIFLVCGMFLTVILWKIRVVKPKIVKPKKKKKPKKIQYKVIYGGEESSTKKMITVDWE